MKSSTVNQIIPHEETKKEVRTIGVMKKLHVASEGSSVPCVPKTVAITSPQEKMYEYKCSACQLLLIPFLTTEDLCGNNLFDTCIEIKIIHFLSKSTVFLEVFLIQTYLQQR